MNISTEKMGILFLKVSLCLLVSIIIYFVVHELSHFMFLLICNGVFEEMHFGITNFVSGYVNQKYVPIIAMSSLFVPLIISIILSLFNKNAYLDIFSLGFSMPSIINAGSGLFATVFITNETRQTFDVAMAYDAAKYPPLIIVISSICLVATITLFIIFGKRFVQKI